MEKYDVIIIGAGASGLMCALNSSRHTLLLEASDRMGKKILATGNGKCNLTNDDINIKNYNTPLVKKYFQQFNNQQTLQFFETLGIFTHTDEAGRRYPLSNSANTILDILLKALSLKNNITVAVNAIPLTITKNNDGCFTVTTKDKNYVCNKLVIATGGNSGTQYLQQLHIGYHAFHPSLVGLKTTKNKGLAGVRVSNVRVKFNNFVEDGEILFKEDGISGIVIFNLSAYLARQKINAGKVTIDLFPNIKQQDLYNLLQASIQHNPQYLIIDVLEGFMHKSLAKNILEKQSLIQKHAHDMTPKNIETIISIMKNYMVEFIGFSDNYQVHTGGVDLNDLDNKLQHKQIPNLFFIGEVVNVDGVCGGYNLQWAWTSGKIVGDGL